MRSGAIVEPLDCPNFPASVGIEDVREDDWVERASRSRAHRAMTGAASRSPMTCGEALMHDEPTAARESFGDIAPTFAEFTDKMLFGDVWRRPNLSPRDRSLITVAALVALYRINELPFHLAKALENGVTRDEIVEVITHLAFYSGWPTASSAVQIARRVFGERGGES